MARAHESGDLTREFRVPECACGGLQAVKSHHEREDEHVAGNEDASDAWSRCFKRQPVQKSADSEPMILQTLYKLNTN